MSDRYNPDNAPLLEQRILSGELSYDKDVVKYVKRAMCAVGEDYTKRTIEAGEAEGPDYPFLSISRINNNCQVTYSELLMYFTIQSTIQTENLYRHQI